MADTLHLGICGAGSFGIARAKALSEIDGVEVTQGWSRSNGARTRFAHTTGGKISDTWQELCGHPDVDAVLICTPNAQHYEHAAAALAAGKHVLVETPLALRVEDARSLAAMAAQGDRVLHHGAKWRYHPDHAEHVEDLRRVGPLITGHLQAVWDFGVDRPWYSDRDFTGGARAFLPYVILDWLEAFGHVTSAQGATCAGERWDSATITLTFASGGCAMITYAIGQGIPEGAIRKIVGEGGTIFAPSDGSPVLEQGGTTRVLEQEQVDIVHCECVAFVQEVRGERDHAADLALDLRALELVDGAFGG